MHAQHSPAASFPLPLSLSPGPCADGGELLALQVYDTRADVYSWGVLLAELLSQKPPYDGMYLTPVQVRRQGISVP